jgi:ATP-binding cassette, subfamily F, member 3
MPSVFYLTTGVIMLSIHNLHKNYGIQPILQNVSFNIGAGERIGLIGPNGSGKTTLMRILAGLERPDSGIVTSTRPNLRIGYLAQGMDLPPGQTIHTALETVASTQADPVAEIESLAAALSQDPNNAELQEKYDSVLNKLSAIGDQPSMVLKSLGLVDIPLATPIAHLSGGQKTRLMLARVLLEEPQLLLLDEPTNHLDIEMLEWLEDWLNRFQGAALIVSHDRAFLDHTVTSIIDLNPDTHSIRVYKGNYSEYLDQYIREQDKQRAAYQDQEYEIKRMKQDINRTKQQSLRVEMSTTPRTPGVRRIAKKVAKKALSREKKLDRYLDSDERIEKPKASWQLKLEFEAGDNASKNVLITDNLSIGYEKPLLSELNLQIRAGQRIALTGSNGTGKTTLIRTIAGKLPPLAGAIKFGANIKLGYMTQEQELLNPDFSALQTIQSVAPFNETEARNFLHYFLFEDDDPLRPSEQLSYGERARLQLGLLVAQGCNFLLLDEPINHLDIPSRARFEEALSSFKGTILAVVHDRYFIERFASDIWIAKDGKIIRE